MSDVDLAQVAQDTLANTARELALAAPELGDAVHDAAAEYKQAIGDIIAAGKQLEADVAELRSKRDLIPPAGFDRLHGEAVAEAKAKADEADGRADRALVALKAAVAEKALPKLDPARESFAREELRAVVGEANGRGVTQRVLKLAQYGSREAVAALLSPYGKTLLIARGLEGHELNEALDFARTFAIASAAENSGTASEILASVVHRDIASLGAARGAAGTYVLNVLRRAGA